MGSDERMTFEEYAKKKNVPVATIEKKFAATGSLVCAGFLSSAQLSGKNNVITTAGHAFHLADCAKMNLEHLRSCYYIHNPGPAETYYDLKTETIKFGGCKSGRDDWAVAELKKPVGKVKPYLVPDRDPQYISGSNVIMTAGSHRDFKRGDRYPKTLTDCQIRDVIPNSDESLRTDCDSGGNSSGGAHLVETEKGLEIISVNIGRPNKYDKPPRGTPYDKDNYYNVAVPLAGDFLKAVQETISKAD